MKRTRYGVGSLFRKSPLSIGRRLTACFLLIAVSMIAGDAVVLWHFRQMVASSRRLSSADQILLAIIRLRLDVGTFRKNVAALESTHRTDEFLTEAAGLQQNFSQNVEDAQQALSKIPEIAREDPTIPAALKVLKLTLPSQLDSAVQLAKAEDWAAVHLRLEHQIQDLVDLSSSLVKKMDAQAQQQRAKAIEDAETARHGLFVVLITAGLLTLILALALGWFVTESITVPLSELTSGAQTLARGDLSHQVSIEGTDELAIVGTAFNHAARQLQEIYGELREQASLLSLTHDAIYVRDMKGVIRYWNRGAEVLFGWPADHAVGEVAHELLKTVSSMPLEQIEAELLRSGRWEGELVKTRQDGTQLVVATRWSLKRDDRREPVAILVTGNDITQRKQAEQDLRQSQAYLAEAQRLSHTGSWAFDVASNRYIHLSEECVQIFGLDPKEPLPTREVVFRRIHPDDSEAVNRTFERTLREKVDTSDEFRIVLAGGAVKHVHVIRHPVLNSSGDVVKLFGTAIDITESKLAEEALRRSEKELRDVIETIPVMAFSARTDGFVEFVNRRYLEYTNLTPESASGSSWQATVHPDDLERTTSKWLEALATGEPLENELRHRNVKGEYRWFLVRAMPLRDEHRNILKWYGILFDIEDRKRAEEALRESETRFRTFVDHAGDALFVYDLEQGTVIDVNREACASLGYTREEIIGKSPLAFHPDSYQGDMESVAERVAEGETVSDTHWHRRKDGSTFPVEVHTTVVSYGGQRFLLTVARDITDRMRAEEAIRQSEKQLREVIETIPAIAWTSDPDGVVEFANRRWQEYTGLSPSEALGSAWKGAVHPKDLDRYVEKRRASLVSGDPIEDEIRIRHGGTGEYRWFITRAVPLRDEQGKIIRWYGTATDIHDRKQVEERVQVENIVLRAEIDKASMFEEVVGASPALQTVLSAVSKVAPTDSTVLLTGQTGTGKELIARAIHRKSERSARAFISVNCAAIPQSLIASELFGHEKGAFTGALQRHLGKFELAEGGTIFLDEIGELPMETQVALLRVLQEREIQRVGGTQPIRVNVRILAATNRDLQKAIAAGTFREDLFYRLNVFPIHVPPLRERKEDIPMLVEYFIDRFARKAGKDIRSIDKQSLELLESYSWPGNIRELQNVVERSVVLCDSDTLRIDNSWVSVGDSAPSVRTGSLSSKIQEQEREFIERALAEAEGKVSGPLGAAAKLGISPSALEYKIRLLKINKHQFKKYLREN